MYEHPNVTSLHVYVSLAMRVVQHVTHKFSYVARNVHDPGNMHPNINYTNIPSRNIASMNNKLLLIDYGPQPKIKLSYCT